MLSKDVLGLATIGSALILSGGSVLAQPVIDGVDLDEVDYGPALWYNDVNPTGFGDNNQPQDGNANGSEIDGIYAYIGLNGLGEDTLFIGVTGNLETNFNKMEFFFDYDPGVETICEESISYMKKVNDRLSA